MTHRPTSELVGINWIKTISGMPTLSVATTLPGPDDEFGNTSWAASGFVQVAVVGGSPDLDVPVRIPVFSVDCWAVNVGKKNPPYGRANAIAEQIVNSVYTYHQAGQHKRLIEIPGGAYAPAVVIGARVLTEPARRLADPANYARYGFELQLTWLAG